MALLKVEGLVKSFGSRRVVDGVSFEVNAGEVVGLLGPNGAGKTTSFRMATGQIVPNEGTVHFDGQDVTDFPMYRRARLGMGYLSQEQSIFRNLTVEKNLYAILEALPKSRTLGRKLTRSERWKNTEDALKQFNLLHVRKSYAARCSGGEKRRLEIARCLVCEPQLILLDEPFAAVDPRTTSDIRVNIRQLADRGIGILLTDHNVREVVKTADRIYLIVEGKVVCHGRPSELINNPIAIEAYLGTTFQDDVLMARVAGFIKDQAISTDELADLTLAAKPAEKTSLIEQLPLDTDIAPILSQAEVTQIQQVQAVPMPVTQPPVEMKPQHQPVPAVVIDDTAPPRSTKTPTITRAPISTPPRPRFSGTAQTLLEREKIRRLVEMLKDRQQMPTAWHELSQKGTAAIPVLLEVMEGRDHELRHLAFRLMESITGDTITYQSDASDEIRIRQVAHLRAKYEP